MQGPMSPSTSVQKRGRIHKNTLKFRTRLTFSWSSAKGICFSPMLRGQVEGAGHNNASILKNERPAPKEPFLSFASKNENETEGCRAKGAGVNQTNTLLSKLPSQPPTGQGSKMFSLITSSLTSNQTGPNSPFSSAEWQSKLLFVRVFFFFYQAAHQIVQQKKNTTAL